MVNQNEGISYGAKSRVTSTNQNIKNWSKNSKAPWCKFWPKSSAVNDIYFFCTENCYFLLKFIQNHVRR